MSEFCADEVAAGGSVAVDGLDTVCGEEDHSEAYSLCAK